MSQKNQPTILKKLSGRWLGQGPMVDKFENDFRKKFAKNYSVVATGSGTDSLHLAYILAGLKKGDEVLLLYSLVQLLIFLCCIWTLK